MTSVCFVGSPKKAALTPLRMSETEKNSKTPSGTPVNKCRRVSLEHTENTGQRTTVTHKKHVFLVYIQIYTMRDIKQCSIPTTLSC